ncbi:hypothetical protein UFOVP116_160 [uncultured Caudovirales phage]|uniref:Uncharacterized protein n=1 Tax=uncultured Caudovirales phage TaxID=2100421 RepID=A0A6J5L672_9CAUD|nr:hypothetical protein UFOVP116_160 [uncultured Caudovirales phage]
MQNTNQTWDWSYKMTELIFVLIGLFFGFAMGFAIYDGLFNYLLKKHSRTGNYLERNGRLYSIKEIPLYR